MEHRFDSLAKSISGAMSRRDAFWRLGNGLAVSMLAFLGLGASQRDNCGFCCASHCINKFPPGLEQAMCIQDCHLGKEPFGSLCGCVS